jgi:hypothetical protein
MPTFADIMGRLARSRRLVALGLVGATLLGILLAFRVSAGLPPQLESRRYPVGVASAAVLLDSRQSQVSDVGDPKVDVNPADLFSRSRVLGSLLVASPLREQIAAAAGVPTRRLITKLSSSGQDAPPASPPPLGLSVRPGDRAARVLDVRLDDQVPIMTFISRAPSRRAAARLSTAAVQELQAYLRQTSSLHAVPQARRLIASSLGDAQSSTESRGPTRTHVVLIAVLAFVAWCAAIVALGGPARRGPEQTAAAPVGRPSTTGVTELEPARLSRADHVA